MTAASLARAAGKIRLDLRMPRRFLRGSYARLWLTLVALACGVALVTAIDLVNRAVLRAFVEVIDTTAGRAALQIAAGEGGLFPEDVAAAAGAVAGVELAVPVVTATAHVADDSGEMLTVHGVEITNEQAVRVYEARDAGGVEIENPLVFLNQADSVVLTRAFAERRRIGLGGKLALDTPNGRRTLTVRGLLDPQGMARVYGGNLAVMDLFAAEAMFTRPGLINRVDVVVRRDADVRRVAGDLAKALPDGLRVETPEQRKADLHAVVRSLHVLLQGMGLVALVAAFLIAFNRLTTVFESRAWQLGVLRAVGLRTAVVWRELLKESVMLGAAGVGLGIPLGIALGRAILPVIATTTALNFKLIAPDAELSVRPASLALATALGLGSAVLGALLPAWRAASLSVAESIRGRGAEQPGGSGRGPWLARLAVAGGAVAAVWAQAHTRNPGFGLLATGLIAIAAATLARPAMTLIEAARAVVLRHMGAPTLRFAAAIIVQHPRRSGLTVGMIGVGLGAVLWLGTVAQSFERSVLDAMPEIFRADLILSSTRIASGMVEAPLDDSLAAGLRELPGVAAVVGERAIDWHFGGGPISIDAFDSEYFSHPEFGGWALLGESAAGARAAVARGDSVLVSSNFAFNLAKRTGDRIRLDTPSGPAEFEIAGVITTFLSPRGTVLMARETFQRLWRDWHVTHLLLRAEPGSDLADLRGRVAGAFGESHRLRILTSADLVRFFAEQVQRAFAPVRVLGAVVLLVILTGMADTLAASVAERNRQFGIVRAVGLHRGHLYRMVLVEALLMGGLGVGLAVAAGLAMGMLWVKTTFTYLLGWVLQPHFPLAQLAVAVAATLAVCVLAALPPARRAGQLRPAAALRYE